MNLCFTLMTNRIVWIDWAKTICMFLVILGHCHIREEEQLVSQFIYSFHMMFFFFLSGMLCSNKLSIRVLIKDFRFLIVPYFTYGFIILLFRLLCKRTFEVQIIWPYIKNLLSGVDIEVGPIWFLPALFICKQMFMIIKVVKNRSVCLYYLCAFFSFFPVLFIDKKNLNLFFFADSAMAGLPFFILGHECLSLFNLISHQRCLKHYLLSVSFCVISALLCVINGHVSLGGCSIGNSLILYYMGALFAIFSISMLSMQISKYELPFVTTISRGTIVILGLHGIPLTMLNYYIPILLGFEPTEYPFFIALLYSTITYCICYYLILILTKICPSPFGLRLKTI